MLSSEITALRAAGEGAPGQGGGRAVERAVIVAGGTALLAAIVATGVLAWNPDLLDQAAAPLPSGVVPLPAPSSLAYEPREFEWVRIPAGVFRLGPPADGRNWSEEVALPEFDILRGEVTNEQWHRYLLERRQNLVTLGKWSTSIPATWSAWMADLPAVRAVLGDPAIPEEWPKEWPRGLPVRGVTFLQAQDFCTWLDQSRIVPGARVPREDEWERAARGDDGRTYPWGEEFLYESERRGVVERRPCAVVSGDSPEPVNFTLRDLSPFRVHHMGGNVSEWTDLPWPSDAARTGPPTVYRKIRGASFRDGPERGGEYARTWESSVEWEWGVSAPYVGFRIARPVQDPPDPAAAGPTPSEGDR